MTTAALRRLGVLFALAAAAPRAGAQVPVAVPVEPLARSYDADSTVVPVPFGPGERLVYNVKIGWFNSGRGQMSIPAVDTLRGRDAYHISMSIDGGFMGLSVHDKYDSWLDIHTLQSWRFIQDIHDPGYTSYRHYEFYPERGIWDREDNDESGPLASQIPLDDIAFIYFVRTLPLEVGATYTFTRYFKAEGNPVTVKVLRRDHRKTDAGEFNTIVVQPIIRTKGLFSQGGKAELHFTDDERRILVYMKSDIPNFPGSLTLHLKEVHEGLPLHPDARARALSGENRGAPGPAEPGSPPWP
ncbi:MAG TPA: DUF3108 domain-containing protein [Longimicrobiales bacterium]|nr:DUF3108 domain-containing protein [Longimicrobiales bacterium]